MMNEMKSKIIWKLRSSRVYRNQISFRVGPCDITIKILPTHLKVYLDPESGTTDRSKVMVTCKEAYLQFQRAMRSVTMGYHECDYYFAFSCTRPECKDHPHPAEISLDTKTLECIVHDRPSDLPENYELWMPQLGGVLIEQIGQIADFMYEWEGSVVEQLGLSRPEVAAIKEKYPKNLNLQTREVLHKWKQKLGTSATSKKLISVFERAGYKDYADNIRQMLVVEDIPSDAADTTSTYSPKPFSEPKPEFPSIESVSLLSSTATTTTTVIIEKENRQEQDEEIVHLKAEELKVLEHETENTDSEHDIEPVVTHSDQSIDKESKQSDEDEDEESCKSQVHTPEKEPQQPSPPASELLEQQDSDTEDQPQPQPQSPLPVSLPGSENGAVQQPIAIDDSVASDQVSHSSELIEEDKDSEGHYDQHNEEPRDPQDYLETMPSASGSTAYGPMKSKGNVPRVRLIVAEDDEDGIVHGEENLHNETVRELDASSIDRKKKLGEGTLTFTGESHKPDANHKTEEEVDSGSQKKTTAQAEACRMYQQQSNHEIGDLGTEKDRVSVPIWIDDELDDSWRDSLHEAVQAINEAAPGLSLSIADKNAAIIYVLATDEKKAYTEGNIRTRSIPGQADYITKIHLGQWEDNKKKGISTRELFHALGANNYLGLTRFDTLSITLYQSEDPAAQRKHHVFLLIRNPVEKNIKLSELDKVGLNLVYRPCKDTHLRASNAVYAPKLGKTGMYYCGRSVMWGRGDTYSTDGKCGPKDGPNCPACRTIKSPKAKKIVDGGRWQGMTGLVYCGRKFAEPKEIDKYHDGMCGINNGPACPGCNQLLNSKF